MLDRLIQFDIDLFLWLNSHHSIFWDQVMWHVSGKMEWLPLYLVLLVYIVYRYKWQSISIIIAIILAITLADQIAVVAFKELFHRFRPSHNPEIQYLIHLVNNYHGGTYGFVSNHAANSFALAVFLSLLFKQKYFTAGILLWASLVSYSRIYLGVHYPADVLGGVLLGSAIAWIMYYLYQKLSLFITTLARKKKKTITLLFRNQKKRL